MASERRTDGIRSRASEVLAAESAAVSVLRDRLDWRAVERLVGLLIAPDGRVATMGCGTSAAAAKKMAHTLCCVGCAAWFVSPSDAPHGGMGGLRRGDIVILVSKGGNTGELVRLLPSLTAIGVTLVTITGVPDSILGRRADLTVRVDVDGEPDPFNMLATASTLAVIAMMDAVAICVMERNGFTREHFGVIHPGGAVGERLVAGATHDDQQQHQ